ncbi:minor extracellular protease vpr [Plectosphaerella cucumerina]|uniref:Minor extracellular protease vpr n=1 Tax=Plectosphaerella cucumerina TaxID=40658 RepID=A0A8K0X729_9PEZI|nr:minor extracellular protease vpr [Plectosphaerella cucumerina]
MRFSPVLLALSGLAAGARTIRRDGTDPADTVVSTKKFIVEVDPAADRDGLVKELEATPGCRVTKVFDSAIFSGVSIESDSLNTDALLALGAVTKAWAAMHIELPPTIEGESFSDAAAAPKYRVHDMTGVDKLHAEGYFGKGVKIGVVDSGLDYRHPDLGGCLGAGCKVAGGHDFVGDDNPWPYPGYEKTPDEDPMDEQGHGTHVAGIISAKGNEIIGVAPEASLYAYKIFGTGGTDEETIIEAFIRAYEDGVDIISASVGSSGGWAETAWAEVSRRIVDEGVVVVIAAGNDGVLGPFAMSSGASSRDALAVASIDGRVASGRRWAATFNLDGHSNRTILAYRPDFELFPPTVVNMPIVPLTLNASVENDACSPLPEDVDFSGVIPLVRLGGCSDMQKEGNLNSRNATYILMYMEDGQLASFSGGGWTFSSKAMITNTAGEAIINTVLAGGNVTADFSLDPNTNYVGIYNSVGGKPSPFTSWGPTFDLGLKPDIAAPGGNILSTVPGGRYRQESGTSMAAPYISGIAALYIAKHGGRSVHGRGFARYLQARIANTGKTVEYTDPSGKDYGFWAPPIQVGTGLVDAVAVLNYTTSMTLAKFHLNDTASFSRYQKVQITNSADDEVEYRFTVQDAAGFETQWTDASEAPFAPRFKDFEELVPIKFTPEVTLPRRSVVLQPGETREVQFNFKQPEGLNASRIPVYSGKILISGSNGDELSAPYFGVAANIKRDIDDLFYSQSGYPRLVSTTNNTSIDQKATFSFDLDPVVQDFPKAQVILRYGTRQLRWDIFEASYREREWSYPPVPGVNKFVGSATSIDYLTLVDFPTVKPSDANNTWAFPLENLPREVPIQGWWLGKLADGTRIKPGKYVMRIGALMPFGNPKAADNWHAWQSPVITVV